MQTRATPLYRNGRGQNRQCFELLGSGQRKLGVDMRLRADLAMRASRAAGFGAGAERFVHDLFDRPGAAAALGAATQTSVDLPGGAWRHLRSADRITHVVIGKNVAGTDNHETARTLGDANSSIFKSATRCKRKNRNFKQFQTDAGGTLE